MMYVPTVMLYFVGVSVFALGPSHAGLADNKTFALTASLLLLILLVVMNVVGLGVGKWINNLGAIGTGVAAAVLIGLGIVMFLRFGTSVTWADFRIPANPKFVLNSFGVICFGLVGLELASVMGDEIESPEKTLPGAVAWGGVLSGLLYIGATLTLLIAINKGDINVLQGIVQAVGHMATRVGVVWIVAPFAFLLSWAIAGIASAWLGGSARIPFVAGLDSYMPSWLGKVHPRYRTPYAALIVHASVSMVLVVLNFSGWWIWNKIIGLSFVGHILQAFGFAVASLSASETGVQETFQKLLSLAVVLQLIPFLYMFGALLRIASSESFVKARYSKTTLILSGASGLVTTVLGIALAFFPAQQVTSLLSYEIWMVGGTIFFIGLAAFFFFIYGRRKAARKLAEAIPAV
jgi:amino acid transporter